MVNRTILTPIEVTPDREGTIPTQNVADSACLSSWSIPTSLPRLPLPSAASSVSRKQKKPHRRQVGNEHGLPPSYDEIEVTAFPSEGHRLASVPVTPHMELHRMESVSQFSSTGADTVESEPDAGTISSPPPSYSRE